MIPLRCSAYDCFEMPMLVYTINKKKIYRCQHHPIKCHTKNCPRSPTMSFKHRDKTIFYCTRHGKSNQINICKNIHCNMIATYGHSTCAKPILCVKHRTNKMEIVTKKCCYFGCHNNAKYNYLNLMKDSTSPKGIYCEKHRNSKMISIDDFNKGYLIKSVDPSKDEDIKYDIDIPEIIKEEYNNMYKKQTEEIKTKNNTFNLIYDMRNDAKIQLRSVLNDYVIIEN